MSKPQPTPLLLHRTFDDFDELAVEVRNWDLDLQQLDQGRFEGELLQAVVGKTLFTELEFGLVVGRKVWCLVHKLVRGGVSRPFLPIRCTQLSGSTGRTSIGIIPPNGTSVDKGTK